MGVEKEGSKSGGGYVGGFFQLFDWKTKSRKKLFSSKSDLPERSKQGKRSDGNLPMTRLHLMDEDEFATGSSIRGGSDYSCASSITDEDGCGARAPGVVARLMGLESMPTSNFSESSSAPFYDTQSLQEASHSRKHVDYYQDHHHIMYSGNLLNKEDAPRRKFADLKPQKQLSRPIEKFQMEILPPKSAKSIPITHHKLLSPIKGPGFIPSKNAAHIMEAAAKIIEASPQAIQKVRMPVVGSSSVPLKVRDLKEKLVVAQKMSLAGSTSAPLTVRDQREKVDSSHRTSRLAEASRRPVESTAAKCLKGQSLNKSWNGPVDTSFRAFPETEEASSGSRNRGKSISLAIQAKVNIQRREGLNSSTSRGLISQKEQSEVMPNQPFKSQPNIQKSSQKKSSLLNSPSVLRQNNQKQNCVMDKDKLPSKHSVSSLQGRKVVSGNSPSGRYRNSGKAFGSRTGTRKLSLELTNGKKEMSNYSTKNIPRKKRSIDGNLHLKKNQVDDSMLVDSNGKVSESKSITWAEESKRKGMDVVSFTFTAPLARSMPGSETPGQIAQKNSGACMDNWGKKLLFDTDSVKLSSVGYNVIGGDALSFLLEEKLRELSDSVEASHGNSIKVGSSSGSASISQDLVPNRSTAPRFNDDEDKYSPFGDKLGNFNCSDTFSTSKAALRLKHTFKGVEEVEESCNKPNDSRKLLDYRGPSPVSVLEPSFSTESSSSLGCTDSSCSEGNKQCSPVEAQEVLGLSSSKRFHYVDADMELSDSASSTSTGIIAGKYADALTASDQTSSTKWEIAYIKKMFCNLELMFQEFAMGRAREIINPHQFDQLESRTYGLRNDNAEARLKRKLLFHCVGECLDLRCRHNVGGGYKTWIKGMAMVRRKEWLAEEVHKEISAWGGMGDCIVDELVDKDMSSRYGRWLEFEVDAFELGAEVEGQIFNALVDELVADILLY